MKKKISILLLALLAIFVCMPVIMVLAESIKSNHELLESLAPILSDAEGRAKFQLLPNYPTLKHYGKLLFQTPQFFVVFWNSVKIVVFILIGQIVISVPAAWAFAGYSFRFRKLLFGIYVVLMLMPFQVTMLSNYLLLDKLELMNTHGAVILPAIFSTFPVFLIYRGFSNMPKEILEAARIDGAGEFKIFIKIAIPIGSSGIFSAVVLGFLEYWNLLEQPLAFLKEKSLWPLSLYLPEIGLSQVGISFAASVITLIPATLVFLIGQDYLEKGIIASAIKG